MRSANGSSASVRALQLAIMSMQDDLRRRPPVSPGISGEEVSALIDAALAAQSELAASGPASEQALIWEQGTWEYEGTDVQYSSYGADGNWQALRKTQTGSTQTAPGQSGTRPQSLADYQALLFPVPAP